MMSESATGDRAAWADAAAAIPDWLVELKARAGKGDRPRDKALGRWLGDFLDQDTPSGLLAAELRLLAACAQGRQCFAVAVPGKQTPAGERIRIEVPSRSLAHGRTRSLPIPSVARVRAQFLRFLVLGGDESAPVHEAGVELCNAFVDGELDLRGAKCVGRLALVRCCIRGKLKIEDASLGILYLQGSRAYGISANRAKIAGSVFLNKGFVCQGTVDFFGATIGGSLQCTGARIRRMKAPHALVCSAATIGGDVSLDANFRANGCIWFNGANLRGSLNCRGASIAAPNDPALCCKSAMIAGDVLVNGSFAAHGSVRFSASTIGGELDCTSGTFTNAAATALDCDGATITGGVRLNLATMVGAVNLLNARIGKDLVCYGASMMCEGGTALMGTSAIIGGNVFLAEAPNAKGDSPRAFVAIGGVTFSGAEIGHDFACWGGRFTNATGNALQLIASRIKGSVFLTEAYYGSAKTGERFVAEGPVAMDGAHIEGDLLCSGGRFTNPRGNALVLDAARIEGNVCLDQVRIDYEAWVGARFEAKGTVSLYRASIGGHLQCTGGGFAAPDQGGSRRAINGEILSVGGCVFFRGPTVEESNRNPGGARFTSDGEVCLVGAQVGMQFNCINSEFVNRAANEERENAAGYALDLGIATIRYELLLGPVARTADAPATLRGSLNLGGATTRELVDRGFVDNEGPSAEHFPATVVGTHALACEVVLSGFSYERLNGNSCLTARGRKAWLMRQPGNALSEDFSHQPFDHLARVLRAMGHEDEARAIAVFKQQRLTRRIPLFWKITAVSGVIAAISLLAFGHWWPAAVVIGLLLVTEARTWLWRIVFEYLVSYGYRPAQGLVIALVIAMVAGWFYQQAEQNAVLAYQQTGKDQVTPAESSAQFHPYIYSFDVMLPVVKLGEAQAWKPIRRGFILRLPWGTGEVSVGENGTQHVVWMETVFGWLAGGILLALVSGLIKKD
jgi:hypothetical protein